MRKQSIMRELYARKGIERTKSLATAYPMENKEQRLQAAGSRNGIISSSFEFWTRHVEYKSERERGGGATKKEKKQKGRN